MEQEILDLVKSTPDGVTFNELEAIEGFNGEYDMTIGEKQNIVLWASVSEDAHKALQNLVQNKKIEAHPCTPLIYILQGKYLTLPIVTSTEPDELQWLPVIFKVSEVENG